jgi:hypothetical protein
MERHRLRRLRIVLLAACALSGHSQDREAVASAAPANPLEMWLDELSFAESGNRPRLVHRDRDGQLYYGCLQFQGRTFRIYVRKYHLLPKANRKELMSRIYDCGFQKRLATLMIRDDSRNWRHWSQTVQKRIGLPPSETGR